MERKGCNEFLFIFLNSDHCQSLSHCVPPELLELKPSLSGYRVLGPSGTLRWFYFIRVWSFIPFVFNFNNAIYQFLWCHPTNALKLRRSATHGRNPKPTQIRQLRMEHDGYTIQNLHIPSVYRRLLKGQDLISILIYTPAERHFLSIDKYRRNPGYAKVISLLIFSINMFCNFRVSNIFF